MTLRKCKKEKFCNSQTDLLTYWYKLWDTFLSPSTFYVNDISWSQKPSLLKFGPETKPLFETAEDLV